MAQTEGGELLQIPRFMGRFYCGGLTNQKRSCLGCRKQVDENMEIKYLKEPQGTSLLGNCGINLWKSSWMAATLDYCEWYSMFTGKSK